EIDDAHAAALAFEIRLQDQRPVTVTPPCGAGALRRREQPAAIFSLAEQRREARAAVEPGQRQPIDRSVTTDQRRAFAMAEQRVGFDREGHVRYSSEKLRT